MSTIPPASLDDSRERWPRRLGVAYGIAVTGVLVAIVALLAWSPLQGRSGLWAHATIGRWIWENGTIPDRSLFLWTASEPYVYHSWLAQLLIFGLTNIGDVQHLAYVAWAFTTLMALIPVALIAAVWHRCGGVSAWMAVPLLLGLKGISVRFDTRPELFTAVCLGLLLMFLVMWSGMPGSTGSPLRRRDKLALAAMVLMFLVWANLHGAVILGIVVLGATAVCDLVQDRLSPKSRALAVAVPLALAAVCVNPYGLAYFSTLARVKSFTFAQIIEWRPIWKNPSVLGEILPTVGVVTALALAAWLMNPQRRWAHLAWLLLLGMFFVQARRNIWPFMLTALMVLAANAGAVNREAIWRFVSRLVPRRAIGQRQASRRFRVVFLAGLLAWLVLEASLLVLNLQTWRPLLPIGLEHGVVGFLRENNLGGRVFNDYENSGYLQWSLRGRPPLYLDMMDSYPDQVMRDYQAIVQMTERGSRLLDEQQIDVVVLTTNRTGQSLVSLAQHLDARPQWVRVFANRAGVIWVRRSPAHEQIWKLRSASVSQVGFALLERYGDDSAVLAPAIVEDIGSGKEPSTSAE